MEVLQVPSELERMVELYRRRKPKRVLEIGSWDGGTLREWLTQGSPQVVVAVDIVHRQPEAYEEWRKPRTKLHVITGSSLERETKAQIAKHAPFDWLFIDGDHGIAAVRNDVALAIKHAAPAAVLVLHDVQRGIFNEGDPAPRIVFEELRQEYESDEFTEEPYDGHWAHGIGVVYL